MDAVFRPGCSALDDKSAIHESVEILLVVKLQLAGSMVVNGRRQHGLGVSCMAELVKRPCLPRLEVDIVVFIDLGGT